ncbi:MAG: 50S ribosomal protein P1 [Nanoarchaeota archaeon]
MEYIYSVMLLNKAGKEITENNIKAVLKAAGIEADIAKVKSLIAALDGVDIEQVIKESSVVSAAAPTSSSNADAPAEEKKEEKKEEEKTSTADAAAGLGSLF